MNSITEICNLAISMLGVGEEIADYDDEDSEEARACRRFYEMARDNVLRDFPWSFANKIGIGLAEVEEDPNNNWAYSYRYPSDCIAFRKILSGTRNDTRQSRISFELGADDDGRLIFTDMDEAEGEYTFKNENVAQYPYDFVEALACRLAYLIAPRIAGGNSANKKAEMLQLYMMAISKAQKTTANEQQPDVEPESEYIRARD